MIIIIIISKIFIKNCTHHCLQHSAEDEVLVGEVVVVVAAGAVTMLINTAIKLQSSLVPTKMPWCICSALWTIICPPTINIDNNTTNKMLMNKPCHAMMEERAALSTRDYFRTRTSSRALQVESCRTSDAATYSTVPLDNTQVINVFSSILEQQPNKRV